MSKDYKWRRADQISDEIVGLVNRHLDEMRKADNIEPLQLVAGLLLAFKGLQATFPSQRPASLRAVEDAITNCLNSLVVANP